MRRSCVRTVGVVLPFVVWFLFGPAVWHVGAQSTYATLTGTVTDASGAVLPGVTLTVTNRSTHIARALVTDEAGAYHVPNLDAGTYRIVATLEGFDEAVRQTELLARQTVRVDLLLAVAGTQEEVDVVAGPPVIETDRATIDQSMSGEEISRLAMNFRATTETSPIVVATLTAGVQQDGGGGISIAGSLPFMTSFSVDGIAVQNTRGGGPMADLLPSVESIQEFKVSAAGNNAEFMQVTDITTTSKSGTNTLRGAVFWFNQNSRFASVSRFAPRDDDGRAIKPEINANTFGGTVGGPVMRNRTFFFATYEGVRRPFEETRSQIVPPDAFRRGDFSSLDHELTDPITGQPYPNNQVPVDPIAARVIDRLFPAQNQDTGVALDRPNLVYNASRDFSIEGVDGRVDHVLTPSYKLSGRFTIKNREDTGISSNPTLGNEADRTALRQAGVTLNAILRPSLLNEVKVGISSQHDTSAYDFAPNAPAFMQELGIAGLPELPAAGGAPAFDFDGEDYIGTTGGQPGDVLSRIVQVSDSVIWLRGRHAVKGGVDFQYVEYKDTISFFSGEDFGFYAFDGQYTGNPFADFLVGLPYSTSYAHSIGPTNPYTHWWGLYLQDTWRPTSTLTIDYGVRYDLRPPMTDRTNQLGNFDPSVPGGRVVVPNEAALALVPDVVRRSLPNTPFVTAAEAGVPETLRHTDANNVNPRLGVAWRPFGDNRTVIRGGIGTFTVPLYGSVNYSLAATVTSDVPVFFNQPTADGFALTLQNAFPSHLRAVPGAGSQDFRRANQFDLRDPTVTQWTLTFERDLGATTGMRVSYIGSKTEDILVSPDLNQIPLNTRGWDALQQTRPFLDWNVVASRENGAHARYDGLELELSKRLSHGLSLNASYTLARHLTDAGAEVPVNFPSENGDQVVNRFRDDEIDFGPITYARRHRFVTTFFYELPFGSGRRFARGGGRALDLVVGGWDLTGILLAQSGALLTPYFTGGDPGGIGANVRGFTSLVRPDQVADGNLDDPTVDRYFDRAAFVIPPDNIGRLGNAALGSLLGPGTNVFSLTCGKSFSIGGRSRLRFEAAFSNLFDIENLDVPSVDAGSDGFARITDVQSGDQAGPRTVQFSLRYVF